MNGVYRAEDPVGNGQARQQLPDASAPRHMGTPDIDERLWRDRRSGQGFDQAPHPLRAVITEVPAGLRVGSIKCGIVSILRITEVDPASAGQLLVYLDQNTAQIEENEANFGAP